MSTMPCNEVFTQLLTHIFGDPQNDLAFIGGADVTPADRLFNDRIVQSFNADCVKLIDKNGLSILGYIFLTNKINTLINLYLPICNARSDLCEYIARSLNSELKFVLTHRWFQAPPEPKYLQEFIRLLNRIKTYYLPTFQLDVENAKLLGYRLAKVELNRSNELFTFPDDIIPFDVPTTFVPRIAPPPGLPHQQYAPPPSPPPQYAPPPHQQYAPPPPLYAPRPPSTPPPPITYPPQQHAPPPPQQQYQVHQVSDSQRVRYGGTRKTHKRHKKQIRKHASKKIKHDK